MPQTRCRLLRRAQFLLELFPAFVQSLQTQLPAMQLDTELIDGTGDFGSLRSVFLELPSQVGNLGLSFSGHGFAHRNSRDLGGFSAALTRESHAGRGRVDDQS